MAEQGTFLGIEKLPIERPLGEAVRIYAKRLACFLAVVTGAFLCFLVMCGFYLLMQDGGNHMGPFIRRVAPYVGVVAKLLVCIMVLVGIWGLLFPRLTRIRPSQRLALAVSVGSTIVMIGALFVVPAEFYFGLILALGPMFYLARH